MEDLAEFWTTIIDNTNVQSQTVKMVDTLTPLGPITTRGARFIRGPIEPLIGIHDPHRSSKNKKRDQQPMFVRSSKGEVSTTIENLMIMELWLKAISNMVEVHCVYLAIHEAA